MINQEEIYQLLRTENWKELVDIFYKRKDIIKTDPLLKHAVETTLNVITSKAIQLETNEEFIESLVTLLLLDGGKFLRLSETQKETITVAIANAKKNNLSFSYHYAKKYPQNEICKSIILEYEKKLPKELEHSQPDELKATENREIDFSHDFKKPLFNSLQEVEFFLALKRVFGTYQIYPNVGLSTILDYEKIKSYLSQKEKDFFFKSSVDFVVFEPFSNYLPTYFFEIDSIWHDSSEQKEKDKIKDKIFSIAGQRLIRIRKVDNSIDELVFERLLQEIRDRIN